MKVQDGKPGALGAAQQAGKAAEPPTKAGGKLAGAEGLSFAQLMLEGGEQSAEAGQGKQEVALRGERELSGLLGEREAALVEVSEQSMARREGFGQEQERAVARRAEGDEAQGQADARVERAEQGAPVVEPRAVEAPERAVAGVERREAAEAAEGVAVGGAGVAGEGAQVKEAAPTADTARAEEVQRLAEQLVESCQTGLDQQGRQVMMLDMQVPGRGCVRVRLRRQGDGVEVRLRADNPALGELLRARSGELRDGMAGRGVAISRLEVAS